jgi:hypothetical protein
MENSILMYYNINDNGKSIFYFNGFPIIKTLSELPKSYSFKQLKLMASASSQDYVFEDSINGKKLNDIIYFFNNNDQYSIDDMDATLQNDIEISIHDDCEITFSFPVSYDYEQLIFRILDDYQYKPQSVINYLKTNKNKYVSIAIPDSILKVYSDFREYWHENE